MCASVCVCVCVCLWRTSLLATVCHLLLGLRELYNPVHLFFCLICCLLHAICHSEMPFRAFSYFSTALCSWLPVKSDERQNHPSKQCMQSLVSFLSCALHTHTPLLALLTLTCVDDYPWWQNRFYFCFFGETQRGVQTRCTKKREIIAVTSPSNVSHFASI